MLLKAVEPFRFGPSQGHHSSTLNKNVIHSRNFSFFFILIAALAAVALTGCSAGVTMMRSASGTDSSGSLPHESTSPSTAIDSPAISLKEPGSLVRISKAHPLATGPILPAHPASSAASFIHQIGVVTHLSYTDTPYYTDFPQILSALQTLGVHHIRDGYYPWPASSPIAQAHQQLAAAGITTDYVVPYNVTTTPAAIEQFANEVGDMESLEAPNECDTSGGCGTSWMANLVAFLPTVNAAAKQLNVPMVGPSFALQDSYLTAGNLSAEMTVNNLHTYFGGRHPGIAGWGGLDLQGNSYGSFSYWLDMATADGPGLGTEITETGYMAYPTTSTPYTLPESVEASYIPRTLLLSFKKGFKETFLYELLDEPSSPGYGLLRSDLSPKPAYTAVRNLIATLSDNGSSFTPGSLPYTISGGDSNLNQLLFEKSDGSFWLALWLEESSWDPANCAPIAVTPENIGIELTGAYHTTNDYQFDSNGNVARFNQPMNAGWASLTVTNQISIVEIHHN
jgi:hypothetical protein